MGQNESKPVLPPGHRSVKELVAFVKDAGSVMAEGRELYGDVFLTGSSLLKDIIGFCGPEALETYDEMRLKGNIDRSKGVPAGILELIGPILTFQQGEEQHDRVKAVELKAFSPENIRSFVKEHIKPVMQTIMSSWAAKGVSFSLAVETKKMVFQVMTTLLFGTDGFYEEEFAALEGFGPTIKKSTKKPDPVGVRCRDKVQAFIKSSVAAAEARKANPKNCVVDLLLADGGMGHALETELWHFMAAGALLTGVAVVNIATAIAQNDGARAKLLAELEGFRAKHDDEEKMWVNYDQIEYLNRVILEVRRLYVCGPKMVTGCVTKEFTFKHGDKEFKVPKGCLAVAGLEATNMHPEVWKDPQKFDPDRFADFDINNGANAYKYVPHSFGQTSKMRCAGETLASTIMQCFCLSLSDFRFKMVPGQDFSLQPDSNTPVPVGGLMVSHFTRVIGSQAAMTEVDFKHGTHADWEFLKLPKAKEFAGHKTDELFDDRRLDLWTRLMIKLIKKKQLAWDNPLASEAITIPKKSRTAGEIYTSRLWHRDSAPR